MMLTDNKWKVRSVDVHEAHSAGGDNQVSQAWERSWQRPLGNGLWAVVTRYFYAVGRDMNEPLKWPADLEEQREYLACTDPADPGSTERQSEYTHTVYERGWAPEKAEEVGGEAAWAAATVCAPPTDDEWNRVMNRYGYSIQRKDTD